MSSGFSTNELLKSLSNYPVVKGDVEGHPFHGNQYETVGGSGGKDKRRPKTSDVTNALKKAGFVRSDTMGGKINNFYTHGFRVKSVGSSGFRVEITPIHRVVQAKDGKKVREMAVFQGGQMTSHSDFKTVLKQYRDALIGAGFDVEKPRNSDMNLTVTGFSAK